MPSYPGVRKIIQTGADQSLTQSRSDASARKAQSLKKDRERIGDIEKTLEGANLSRDDGLPPLAPENVQVTPYFHELIVGWDDPPSADRVALSIIRVTPEGESPIDGQGDPASGFVKNLTAKPHSVIVKLVDEFGRESPWSDPLDATPLLTAAETIDLGELAILNRIRGRLPNANLETITDATRLGAGIVGNGALGPGAVTGPKVAESAIATTHITDNGITTPKIAAGAVKTNQLEAGAVSTPKLTAGAVTANELASDAVITRHLSAGAVTADVMAVQDSAAFNLWAQNAMIRSAAIQSLTVDKIVGGQFTAGQIMLAGGGSLKAGQITFDSGGITMPNLLEYFKLDRDQEWKITSATGLQALYFVRTSNANAGVLQGSSDATRRGFSYLAAIHDPNTYSAWDNATFRALSYKPSDGEVSFAEMRAARSRIFARDSAEIVADRIDIFGTLQGFTGQRATVPANSSVQWNHNFLSKYGYYPHIVMGYRQNGDGTYSPLPKGPNNELNVQEVSGNAILVINYGNVSETVSVEVY